MNDILYPIHGKAPETSTALLRDLATGADAVRWAEFVRLYTPVMHCFLHSLRKTKMPGLSPELFDDIVQDIHNRFIDSFDHDADRTSC